MKPKDNPRIQRRADELWRFTVRSDLENQLYYLYFETEEGGIEYMNTVYRSSSWTDWLGNDGMDRVTERRPPV